MILTMFKSFDRKNDSLVALKTKLDKVIFLLKVALMTTINIFSSINNVNFVKSKNI